MFRRKGKKPENSEVEEQVEVLTEEVVPSEDFEEDAEEVDAAAGESNEREEDSPTPEETAEVVDEDEEEVLVAPEAAPGSSEAEVESTELDEAELEEIESAVVEAAAEDLDAAGEDDLEQTEVVAEEAVEEEDEEDVPGAAGDSFMGFQDTISLSTESYPATKPAVPEEAETDATQGEVAEAEVAVTEVSAGASTESKSAEDAEPATDVEVSEVEETDDSAGEALLEGEPEETKDTAVLRRSLLETPEKTESAYPSRRAHRISGDDKEDALDEGLGFLAGGTVLPTLPSRAGARWLSAFGTIILTPVMWYLLADAGARLAFADGNPMTTGVVNPAALMELVAGLLIVVLVGMLAAQSSIGLILAGVLVLAIGVPFLAAPTWTEGLFGYLTGLEEFNAFGSNVVAHLGFTGFTGILVISGFMMIAAGWVVASVRRQGRREEATRVEVALANPDGLKARWARKATEKPE